MKVKVKLAPMLALALVLSAPAQEQPPLTPAPAVEIPAEELWLKLTSSSGRKKLDLVIAHKTNLARSKNTAVAWRQYVQFVDKLVAAKLGK